MTRAQLCTVLHCLPSQLDQEDAERIHEIILYLNAKSARTERDRVQAQQLADLRRGG